MSDSDAPVSDRANRWVNRVLAFAFIVVFLRMLPPFLGQLGGGGAVYSLVSLLIILGFLGGLAVGLYVLVTGDDGAGLSSRSSV